jgi:hypothetical protein
MGKSRHFVFLLLGICTILLFQNCSRDGGTISYADSFPNSLPQYYFKSTQKVVVEVYYEPGAEPFVGTASNGNPYWNIVEDNLNAIFQYRSQAPVMVVPKVLTDMTALPAQNRSTWSGTDIMNLFIDHHQGIASKTEARFYIYFLKGNYYTKKSGVNTSVLGVSINGTPLIAMFKDVIKGTGNNPNGIVRRYIEQSSLVHELGHGLGFVNNGVPMVTDHQDKDHGAHTTNQDCVMFWQNEGEADLLNFIQHYMTTGNTVMWGQEVLADVQAYSE